MIARYTRAEMGRIWSDENKYQMWLEVEAAASETLAEDGIVPAAAARAIRERGKIDVARINAIEAEVRHDVIAFTTSVAEHVGPEARWLHYGLTSTDVVDTAQALQIKAASKILCLLRPLRLEAYMAASADCCTEVRSWPSRGKILIPMLAVT